MSLKWVDVLEIAIQLAEPKPDVDPRYVNFVDLHHWVLSLPEFTDDPAARWRESAGSDPGRLDRRADNGSGSHLGRYAFHPACVFSVGLTLMLNPRIIRGFIFSAFQLPPAFWSYSMAVQRTFSIIKPDAVAKNVIGEITTRFEKAGLRVVASKMMQLSEREADGFYAEHSARGFFKDLVAFMTSGPVIVQVLEGENAVAQEPRADGRHQPEGSRCRHHPRRLRRIHRRERRARFRLRSRRCARNRLLLRRYRSCATAFADHG